MERPSVRRGSVTALLLVVIASLGALLSLELVWWNQLRVEADDAAEHLRLQNEALSVLAEVTNWLYTNRPGNPEDASPRPIELAASETPERLEISIPSDVCTPPPLGIAVSVKVQWCLYSVSGGLPAENALDWPPSLSEKPGGERAFAQSYAQTRPGPAVSVRSDFAAWRVIVKAHSAGTDENGGRSVTVERVVAVGA